MPSDNVPPTAAIPLNETADPVAVDLARRLRWETADDPGHPGVVASTPSLPSGELRETIIRPRLSSSKAYELAFRPVYDKLCSGELQAWARPDILAARQAIPTSVWRTLRFWDIEWERGVIFPKLPHRTLYDVVVAPATVMSKVPNGAGGSATKRRSGPKPDKCDAVAERMREDVEKNGGTDFLKNMKVELLVEHYDKPVSAKRTDLHNGAGSEFSNRLPRIKPGQPLAVGVRSSLTPNDSEHRLFDNSFLNYYSTYPSGDA